MQCTRDIVRMHEATGIVQSIYAIHGCFNLCLPLKLQCRADPRPREQAHVPEGRSPSRPIIRLPGMAMKQVESLLVTSEAAFELYRDPVGQVGVDQMYDRSNSHEILTGNIEIGS